VLSEAIKSAGVYVFKWKKARPDVPIDAIILKSAKSSVIPVVIAITGSSADRKLVPVEAAGE